MTDTIIDGEAKREITLSLRVPYAEYDYRHLAHKLLLRRKVIIRANRTALERQVTILLYLFKHQSMTAIQLRSMMNLPPITGFRYMAALTHTGLVKWKGSHKRGAYMITEEGKRFVTDPALY